MTQKDSNTEKKKTCILTVDVEDWFHLAGAGLDYQFRLPAPGLHQWDKFEQRLDYSVNWILSVLEAHNTLATFFILGWVADRNPALVAEIARRGHEIASHGYGHRVLHHQSPKEFLADVKNAERAIFSACGRKPEGFRASSATITDWALEILANEGYCYDASYYPVTYHDVYGKLSHVDNSKPIEKHSNGLWLVKFSSLQVNQVMIPWSGGGYFRLLPYSIFRKGIHRILNTTGVYSFYIHPWEIDPEAPVLKGLKTGYKLRRTIGRRFTRKRFENLLKEFHFDTIKSVLMTNNPALIRQDNNENHRLY